MDPSEKSLIRIKLESSSIRASFCILSCIGDTCYISFSRDGFTVFCTSNVQAKVRKGNNSAIIQKTEPVYYFPINLCSKYDYRIPKEELSSLGIYQISFKIEDFVGRIKSLKKETLSLRLYPIQKAASVKMVIKSPSGGERYVDCLVVKKPINYVDQHNKWYSDKQPRAKPLMSIFEQTLDTSKHSKCSELCFCFNERTGKMNVDCHSPSKGTIQSDYFDDSDSSYEGEKQEDIRIKRYIYISNNSWIYKLPSLNQTGSLNIYCSEDEKAPLILKTNIGCQGFATFSIPNIKKEN
jgi:hypothetical protein